MDKTIKRFSEIKNENKDLVLKLMGKAAKNEQTIYGEVSDWIRDYHSDLSLLEREVLAKMLLGDLVIHHSELLQPKNPAKVWVVSIVEYKADDNYLDSYTELYADKEQAKARVDEYSTKAIDAAPEHDGLDDGGELVGEQGYVTYFKNGDIAKVKYMEKEVK